MGRTLIIAALCVACAGSGSDAPDDTGDPASDCVHDEIDNDPRFDALLSELDALITPPPTDGPSGLAMAVLHEGEWKGLGGVGFRSAPGGGLEHRPVDGFSVFPIASTSKWITGVAALSLVDDGALALDGAVTDWLPDYTESLGRQDAITLRHLMTMTSGLANDGGCWLYSVSASEEPQGCASLIRDDMTPLQALFEPATLAMSPYDGSQGINNATLNGVPGEAPWTYSNWGTMLTGRLVEEAAGQPFEQVVAERVFGPAGMCTATFDADEAVQADLHVHGAGDALVSGHCPEPERGHDCEAPWLPGELDCPARAPNGGVKASVADLGRFAEVLLDDLQGRERVLSASAAQAMICPDQEAPDGCGRVPTGDAAQSAFGDTYGLFNFGETHNGHQLYTHGGGRAGFGALFWIVPDEQFALVILGNHEAIAGGLAPFGRQVVDCFLGGVCP